MSDRPRALPSGIFASSAGGHENNVALTLPHEFDTTGVWRTILTGAFGLTVVVILLLLYALASRQWAAAIPLALSSAMLLFFSRLFFRFQTGSAGTLTAERIAVRPNKLLWLSLPGPSGTYALDRFSAVRVEFRSGPVRPGVQGGPNEVVWLVGKPGTPDIALARAQDGAGRSVGQDLAMLLNLPVEEAGVPRVIEL